MFMLPRCRRESCDASLIAAAATALRRRTQRFVRTLERSIGESLSSGKRGNRVRRRDFHRRLYRSPWRQERPEYAGNASALFIWFGIAPARADNRGARDFRNVGHYLRTGLPSGVKPGWRHALCISDSRSRRGNAYEHIGAREHIRKAAAVRIGDFATSAFADLSLACRRISRLFCRIAQGFNAHRYKKAENRIPAPAPFITTFISSVSCL